jgi:hypothetical protein
MSKWTNFKFISMFDNQCHRHPICIPDNYKLQGSEGGANFNVSLLKYDGVISWIGDLRDFTNTVAVIDEILLMLIKNQCSGYSLLHFYKLHLADCNHSFEDVKIKSRRGFLKNNQIWEVVSLVYGNKRYSLGAIFDFGAYGDTIDFKKSRTLKRHY